MTNNALIALQSSVIADEQVQSVDARELHSFLEVNRDFSNWIKQRIDEYGFKENQDLVNFRQNGRKIGRGRPAIEYHITLDMAKELAMVERNERGREARRYFIECEKQLRQQIIQSAQPIALPRQIRRGEDLSFTYRDAGGLLRWWPLTPPSKEWSINVEHGEQMFDEVIQFAKLSPNKAEEALSFILHAQVAPSISRCGMEFGFRCSVASQAIRGIRCRDSG